MSRYKYSGVIEADTLEDAEEVMITRVHGVDVEAIPHRMVALHDLKELDSA